METIKCQNPESVGGVMCAHTCLYSLLRCVDLSV